MGDEPPLLDDPTLVVESRKYLAAAYMFVDQRESAERQFELLLRQEPSYPLDPALPSAVQEAFRVVRDRLETSRRQEEEALRRREEAQRQRAVERLRAAQDREMRLRELARTEVVETENSRWLALLPFGVGQFQNGDEALGWVLAIAEGLMAATSIVSAIIWSSLVNDDRTLEAVQAERTARLTNQVSTIAFYATALGGILDAQLRFVPSVRTTRERALPPELEEAPVDLSLSPLGARLRLRF